MVIHVHNVQKVKKKYVTHLSLVLFIAWLCGSAVAQCLTRNRGVAGWSLTDVTSLCPWPRHINPCLVLVQPTKTCTWKFVDWDVKNQTKQTKTKQGFATTRANKVFHVERDTTCVVLTSFYILFEPWHEISNNQVCATNRVRPACAYAQTDQSLC